MSYASVDYNIGINMSCKKDLDIEKLSKLLSGIEGAEDYLVGAGYDFDVDKPEYTKEYGEYCGQLYDDSEDVSQEFLITVLDDKSYDKYASDAGIKNAAAGAILVNKGTFDVYNENSLKYVKKEMELYKYKAGDTIECGYNVYDDASSDDNAAEGDTESRTDDNNAVEGDTESGTEDNSGYVDEETINNGVRKTVDVTIAGVTDKVPTGYKGYGNTTLLFMNQKALKAYGLTARAVMSSNRDMRHIRHMWLQKMQMNIRIHSKRRRKEILSIRRLVFMSAIWIRRCAMKSLSLHCLEYLHTDLLWSLP